MYEFVDSVTDTGKGSNALKNISKWRKNGTIRKREETCSWKNIEVKPSYNVPFY
jgi:hypothetical protein